MEEGWDIKICENFQMSSECEVSGCCVLRD